MKEIIKHYQTLLTGEQFIVTGSYALSKMGLVSESSVKDLDIVIINPTADTESLLRRLQEEHPARTKPTGQSDLFAIFMHENKIKIDVFVSTEANNTSLIVDGFFIAKADHIVKAKKKAARAKDWLQLTRMAESIMSSSETVKFLRETDIDSLTKTDY